MKNKNCISIVIALLLMIVGSGKISAESHFDDVADIKGVEYIYISEEMLKTVGGQVSLGMLPAVSNLTCVEIVSCENKDAIAKVKAKIPTMIKDMELLSKIKDEEENTAFYGKKNNGYLIEFIMIVDEGDEIEIIGLKGKINPDELKELMNLN